MSSSAELTKLAYLKAIGVPVYVSRTSLQGAAPSQRRVVPTAAAGTATAGKPLAEKAAASPSGGEQQPGPAGKLRVAPASQARRQADRSLPEPSAAATGTPAPVEKFNIAAIVAGPWLWLEDLELRPLTQDQAQLIQAMARALGASTRQFHQSQFDWPLHNNVQLDQSLEAARAAFTSFVARQVEQHGCHGVIILGADSGRCLATSELPATSCVTTLSTAAMLAQPGLKKQAWNDLSVLHPGT